MTRKSPKNKGRGGARPGAGRPPILADPVKLVIQVERDAVAWLDAQPGTRPAVIRRLIDEARGREVRRKTA